MGSAEFSDDTGGSGDTTAAYVIGTADAALTNAINLGALNTGIITSTVSAGVATLSTSPVLALLSSLSVASSASAVLDAAKIAAQTVTVTGSTHVTTAAGFNYATLGAPTYSAASALTIDNAATLAIAGPPVGGGAGPATITNAYALWVQAGLTRLGGGCQTVVTSSDANPQTAGIEASVNNFGSNNAWFFLMNGTQRSGGLCGQGGANTLTVWGNQIIKFITGANVYAGEFTSNSNLLLGTNTDVASTVLRVSPAKTVASASGAVWDGVDVIASTLTLSGSTHVTTATGVNLAQFRAPTITAGSALTVDYAATLAVSGAPIAGGSATLTNTYAVWSQGGINRFDGNGSFVFELPADATGNTTNATGRVPIKVGGATKYIRYFDS